MPPQRSGVRVRVHPLGDTALLAELGTRLDTALNTRAIALAAALQRRRDVRRAVAGHGTVTVQFDPDQITLDALAVAIARLARKRPPVDEPGRLHRIPVVYDGPDLDAVATARGLSPRQVIDLHTRPIYRVFLVGFVPGWAYMGPIADGLVPPGPSVARRHVLRGTGARGAAALECTLRGPRLVALRACLVAITGADLEPRVSGRPVPMWSVFALEEGDELAFGARRLGARAYVAVDGGIAADRWLGSVSTNLMVGRGGMQGRALIAGDVISTGEQKTRTIPGRGLAEAMRPAYADRTLHAVAGPHTSRDSLFDATFQVSPDSNRMGYR